MDSVSEIKDLKVKVTNRQILSIALPITLAILIPQINMLTNSIFLGNLSQEALGDAGITGVYYLIFAVAGHGLNNALQSIFSKHAGAGKSDRFACIFSQGIRISLYFSLLGILVTWCIAPLILRQFAAPASFPTEMSFLRIRIFGLPFLFLFQLGNAFLVASLNSHLLIIGFVIEASINILLDYILIFGHAGLPALGFNGAAIASLIAEICGMVAVFLVIYKTGLKRKYSLFRDLSYDKHFHKEILNISAPLIFQYIISVTTWLVFFFLIEEKGKMAKAISNTMRNVFGLSGIFVWAFAGTSNAMVSNLIGQKREDMVIYTIKKIMFWSFCCCLFMVSVINIFPQVFFGFFGQGLEFISEATPVVKTVSAGLLAMSMANIWLNGVTGTGRTRINLLIEIVAITVYMLYTWYFMKIHYISLSMAWSNEFVYWCIILMLSYGFIKKGSWRVPR